MGNVKRAQDERVHQAEDDGVGADGQRQSYDRGDGEARGFAQDTQREPHVLKECLHEMPAEGILALFLIPFACAELDAGAAFGFCARQAFAFEIVGAVGDVGGKLRFDVGGRRAAGRFGNQSAELSEDVHGWASSLCACAELLEKSMPATSSKTWGSPRRPGRPRY